MPRGDRSGPGGAGPVTGRGAGYCAGTGAPGVATAGGFGYGAGAGFCGAGFYGGGRGRRNMFYATGVPGWARFSGKAPYPPNAAVDPSVAQDALRRRADALRAELDDLEGRLGTMGQEESSE